MILQLGAFDHLTAPASRLVNLAGIWESLPRLSRGLPIARLLISADTLSREDIVEGFKKVATPEKHLPAGVMAYRLAYEDYLESVVQAVRYTRLYLAMDPILDEDALIGLMGAYGVQASALDHELPRPFDRAVAEWDRLRSEDGRYLAVLRTRFNQYGSVIHPRILHKLLGQDFPLWAALQIYTFPQRETTKLLRLKSAMARYGGTSDDEGQREAQTAESGLQSVRELVLRGEALHAVNLYVVVDAADMRTLNTRVEITRGSVGLEMERVYGAGDLVPRLFSTDLSGTGASEGIPMTTSGAALLGGSALSYRRRTQTKGVMIGIDRNQSPVVINIFNDAAPSYNTVVLGQTGAGKTFAVLVMMMRHVMTGARLVMIDPQGNIDLSFLGADVYQRSVVGTSQASINVLDIVHEEIGSQIEMALSMLRMLGVHKDQQVERALLDEALMSLYSPIWGDKEAKPPILPDLLAWMEKRAVETNSELVRTTAETLCLVLRGYVVGSSAELFGRNTTIDFRLDHVVNVFDVSRLPQQGMGGNLRSALLSILVANINQSIRRRRRDGDRAPILFFVDEMGILMRDAVVADYISSEYKTARARLVGMIVADQDLHSLLGPRDEKGIHHGVPILANAANTFIFNQKESEQATIREHFPTLPVGMIDALPILPRGTCIASFPDDLLVVNILPGQFERIVFSSRLQDRERAFQIVERLKAEIRS
jgi:hypothetical protein